MVDGPLLRALKWVVRLAWAAEWAIRRRADPGPWTLAGACRRCAKCCEEPAIRVGRLTFAFAPLRALVLGWQRRVNGFVLVRADAEARAFRFRCTHFEPVTRTCDSYASRPFMCRDYPRALLAQPWPELFEGCGYRVRLRRAEGLAEALDRADLPEAERAELKRKLRLE